MPLLNNLYIFQISYVVGLHQENGVKIYSNPLLSEFDDYLNTEKAHYLSNENNYEEKATLKIIRKRMSLILEFFGWAQRFLNTTENKRYGF